MCVCVSVLVFACNESESMTTVVALVTQVLGADAVFGWGGGGDRLSNSHTSTL